MARPRSRTDEEVHAATLRAVARHGVGSLTLAHIGREAGLAPSTLAERFGSKRALLLAAARSAVAGVARIDSLVEGLVRYAAGAADRQAFANSLSLLALDVADPEFNAVARAHTEAMTARLRELASGYADPDGVARALLVAYNGTLVLWGLAGEGRLDDALRAELLRVEAQAEPVQRP